MNLLAARIESVGNRFELALAGTRFRMPVPLEASGGGRPVGEVTLGIRPEDIYEAVPPEISARVVQLPVKVVAVEPLGAETILVLALIGSGEELLARIVRNSRLALGDQAEIMLDAAAIHLFDRQTGRAVARAQP